MPLLRIICWAIIFLTRLRLRDYMKLLSLKTAKTDQLIIYIYFICLFLILIQIKLFPTSVPTEDQTMSSKPPSQSPTSIISSRENLQEGPKEEASASDGTNSTVIIVTVTLLLVALALTLGYLVYCRRRKR